MQPGEWHHGIIFSTFHRLGTRIQSLGHCSPKQNGVFVSQVFYSINVAGRENIADRS